MNAEDNKLITLADLQVLTTHCLNILTFTEALRGDQEIADAYKFSEETFASIRKLLIGSIMYRKKLICISGLQGAGKTTMIKNFYGLDSRYLRPCLGRGERIPILVTEKQDISEPAGYAIRIAKSSDGKYADQSVKLSEDEFVNASTGKDPQIMYLELQVPYRHTFDEGISFLLLPGFEKKNDYWNDLIEFSVNSSDAAVFVFNETRFANAENQKYIDIVKEKFGEKIIYAISGSDGSLDNNAEVKQTCIPVLQIPTLETDRIICVGEYTDDSKNEAWIGQFKNALDKYAYRETEQLKKNSRYLQKELLKINDLLLQVQQILKISTDIDMKDFSNDVMLKAFDRAVKKRRKLFEEKLDAQFDAAKAESDNELRERFSRGIKAADIKRLFFGNTLKQHKETVKIIQDALKDETGRSLPDKYLGLALRGSLDILDRPEVKTDLSRLVDTKKDENGQIQLLSGEKTQALVNDICVLLADCQETSANTALQCKSPQKLMSALTEIAMYYWGLDSYDRIAGTTGLGYYEPAKVGVVEDTMLKGAESSKKFAAGMAGMLGIDLLGDGTINMISQIASSLNIAVPVVGVAATAVIGAGAATSVVKDLNRMQREDLQSAILAIDGVYDKYKLDALKQYDTNMERIRDRIVDNITDAAGEGARIIAIHNTRREINYALELLKQISSKCRADEAELLWR